VDRRKRAVTVMAPVQVIQISGMVPYQPMLERQREVHAQVADGSGPNTLFLLEHAPTITLGRNARKEHVLADGETLSQAGVVCVDVDRGGDVTYHGPGQLVAYPILDLRQWRPSVSWYMRALEETVIRLLERYRITGKRVHGYTGVWVDEAKVVAIGVGLKQWVSWHGLALNVTPDERHWKMIVPCGIQDKPVTSLARLMDEPPSMEEIVEQYVRVFEEVFNCATTVHHEAWPTSRQGTLG